MKNKDFIIVNLLLIIVNVPVSYFYTQGLTKCCENGFFIPYIILDMVIIPVITFIFGFVVSIFIKSHDSYKQRAVNNSLFILTVFQSLFFIALLYGIITR